VVNGFLESGVSLILDGVTGGVTESFIFNIRNSICPLVCAGILGYLVYDRLLIIVDIPHIQSP
jgi:hypothetical protein